MRRALLALGLSLALLSLAALAGSCDPVHDDAVSALGGETAGIPQGPLHRAGQPCLVCHDGSSGPPAFTMAGTVYKDGNALAPLVGGVVTLQGADGASVTATTNAAGNFYLTPGNYAPVYPVHVTSITSGSVSVTMHSHIGGNGSCAGCHVDPAGPDSPGHVYFDVAGVSP